MGCGGGGEGVGLRTGEERGQGRCVTLKRCDTGPAGVRTGHFGRPHASRGASLLERGGPLVAGRLGKR